MAQVGSMAATKTMLKISQKASTLKTRTNGLNMTMAMMPPIGTCDAGGQAKRMPATRVKAILQTLQSGVKTWESTIMKTPMT